MTQGKSREEERDRNVEERIMTSSGHLQDSIYLSIHVELGKYECSTRGTRSNFAKMKGRY